MLDWKSFESYATKLIMVRVIKKRSEHMYVRQKFFDNVMNIEYCQSKLQSEDMLKKITWTPI